ncbi:hypothetical protein [Rheinheimera sp. F8]|uniref:hypothetical protein n=1 Tax=Rheinheimera sp. F8 TaxID=1763998 RepID=UPI000744B865|nr:hypothetical protein [Rheinheimera sp. F8]ALZ75388.1 hypothetical protein ATY27_06225 [Rheinheimera sp. F8]ALZ75798.1 hypothetical protein ATY27_08480 [Rheinheimera sp. F8]
MDVFKITNPTISRNKKFCSFFSTIARWQATKKTENIYCGSFQVNEQSEPIGQFEFDYTMTSKGQITLLELRIFKYDQGNHIKIATYNFITNSIKIHRLKATSVLNRYLTNLKKLMDWFCAEYEFNALRQTEFSLFAHNE